MVCPYLLLYSVVDLLHPSINTAKKLFVLPDMVHSFESQIIDVFFYNIDSLTPVWYNG